jgi:integrase
MPRKATRDYTGTFKRGKIWWYHVPEQGVAGKTKYVSSGSTDRDVCLDKRNEELNRVRGGETPTPMKITVGEILDDYLSYLGREGKASFATKGYHAKHLKEFMGNYRAYMVGSQKSLEYREWRRQQTSHLKTPICDATINRELETLIAAFHYGTNKMTPPTVKAVPQIVIIDKAEEDGIREGTLSKEMYSVVRDAILDEGLRAMFVVSYEVGIRAGELLKMRWDMIDMERGYVFLPWRVTKNGKAGALPIWDDGDMRPALTYMKMAQEQWNPSCPYVFRWCRGRYQGRRIKDYRESWELARKKAGLPELLFHDLRRSTVTNMAIEGFVKEHRQLISRHSDDRMLDRYDRTYTEALDLMKKKRLENAVELKAIAAPAPQNPIELPESLRKYEQLTPAQRAIIDGMIAQMPVAS